MAGGTRSYEFARRLVNEGHEVHIITSDCANDRFAGWRVTHEAGIIVHWLSAPYSNHMTYPERIKAFLFFSFKAAKKAASLPADLILATSTPLTIAIPAVHAARRQRIPLVFEVRDLWPELPIAMGALPRLVIPFARWLERFAYQNSAHIVALSPGMREGILKQCIPSERVHVIPNSADVELFDVPPELGRSFRRQHGWLQNRPLVVYAGTLGRINGVIYLVELAAQAAQIDPEICFLIVGDGYDQSLIRQRADELQVLNKNLFMMESIPKREMAAVLSAATIATSVFIDLPEMWNNSANKFFDALAAGKPIAINYKGWQAELLEETGAGLVLPAKDPTMAAHTLLEFLHNPRKLEQAGQAARNLAYHRFHRDLNARQLMNVLRLALGQDDNCPDRAYRATAK